MMVLRLRALWWLALLGPFFFLSYNFANSYAAGREDVESIAFAWERGLPFWGWMILPYWSSDLLYGLSLLACRDRQQLDQHGQRLLLLQVVCVACFLLFPLRLTWQRPALDGWIGFGFEQLTRFDLPYNQAPSLHVAIAVVLWSVFRDFLKGPARIAMAIWLWLVALSAWFTYQHHFFDLPTGAWVGLLVWAAIPGQRGARALASLYLCAGVLLFALALWLRGWGWLLLWPSFSLSMVAAAYWSLNPSWMGKREGKLPMWIWPYTLGAWINSRIWTRHLDAANPISNRVSIGRSPGSQDRAQWDEVIDLTAELPVSQARCVPILDLGGLDPDNLEAAVAEVEKTRGRTLICCALGFSRSAVVGAAWLYRSGQAPSLEDAVQRVKRARPQVRIHPAHEALLQQWADRFGRKQV